MWSCNLTGTADEIANALNDIWVGMPDGNTKELFLYSKNRISEVVRIYEGDGTQRLKLIANGDYHGLQLSVEVL